MQQPDYNNEKGVFLRGPCRDIINMGHSQLTVQLNFLWQAVKKGLERVKLKNLQC
jgi:hypothetical protein